MTNSTTTTIQMTAQGLEELKGELSLLADTKLPEVIKRVAEARSHGDLSENAEYQNAKEEQQLVEARIEEIQEIIRKAQVVTQTKSTTKVGMGSNVILTSPSLKNKTISYTIVGEFEANPMEGKISSDSPIGKALMGKKKGDQATVSAPAGKIVYTIKDIS